MNPLEMGLLGEFVRMPHEFQTTGLPEPRSGNHKCSEGPDSLVGLFCLVCYQSWPCLTQQANVWQRGLSREYRYKHGLSEFEADALAAANYEMVGKTL